MKKIFSISILFVVFIINYSCAQDLKPLDNENKNIILTDEVNYEMKLIFEDKNIIWGIEFFDDNSILASVKSGSLFHYKNGTKTEIKGLPEIYFRGQGGLLDIAIHPNFKENKFLYFSYSSEDIMGKGGNTTIARAKLINNSLIDLEVLYKGSPETKKGQHFGGRLEFDNNNFLYFSIGDRGNRNVNPQDITIDGGKIYRIKDDGTIPEDNPFYNSPNAKKAIYSFGHRNPQGMFKHPETGEIWTNEHGPRGGDEINIIQKGKNYGWPKITYGINYSGTTITKDKSLPEMEQPLYYWLPSIAPSSFEYISSEIYPNWKGSLLAGALVFKYIERLEIKNNMVVSRSKIAEDLGRPRDVKQGPDGYIYVSIENKGVYKIIPSKKKNLKISELNNHPIGKELYEDFCVRCHMSNGKGVEGAYPPLANADYLINKRIESIKAIKYGLSGPIVVNGVNYNLNMEKTGLDNQEIADVMNYILNSWGNKTEKLVTENEVDKV